MGLKQLASEEATARPVHGGLNFAELDSLGIPPQDVIDFSASINPLGPSAAALSAAHRVDVAAYPDPECGRLRRAIAESLGVGSENVLPGNGSTELIHLLARAFLGTGDSAAIFTPTFGEYVAAARGQGVEAVTIPAGPWCAADGPFRWDIGAATQTIEALKPSLVFLCNPNNPTGILWSEADIREVAQALDGVGLLVLDEAYMPLADDPWISNDLLALGNVILLRSMTKDYGLTGLRLGYMIAPQEIAEGVGRHQYSWSVNAAAQAAGVASIADAKHVSAGRDAVQEGKLYLRGVSEALGVFCPPAAANFLLLQVGDARAVRSALLTQHHVCVRDCTSFGMPDFIRIGIRTMADNRKLARALERVLGGR